jgi:hypothetical protein
MKTSQKQYNDVNKYLNTNQIDSLITQIESYKNKYYKEKDKVLFYLDIGMLHHYAGNYQESNQYLEKAERVIEDLYTKSVSKGALSLILNDNALDYFGEDYEDIYINIFKALNYMNLNDYHDSYVEIRRINNKLNRLEDKYSSVASQLSRSNDSKFGIKYGKNQFKNCAIGRYLSFVMYRKDGLYDDAQIDLKKLFTAFDTQSDLYNFPIPSINNDILCKDGKTEFIIICCIGKSPVKKENKLVVETQKGYLSIRGVGDYDFHDRISMDVDEGFHIKFSFPSIYQQNSEIDFVKVFVDEKPFKLMKIEDIGNVAEATFEVKKPVIYGKTLARALVKGLGSNVFKKWVKDTAKKEEKKQKDKSDDEDMITFLFEVGTDIANWAVDSAVDATENADLRISRFFPDAIYMTETYVTPGKHNVKIQFYDAYGRLLKEDSKIISASSKTCNIVESFCLK